MEPRAILTAAEMRAVDAATIDAGIPGLVLMENAAHRVVEFLAERFGPLAQRRIVVLCGKGNNGGDGLAIARQLLTRCAPVSLEVALACPPEELKGDALENFRMWTACGGVTQFALRPAMQLADLVIDAILGTGVTGPARGTALEWITAINDGFPLARVVAVDVPSGMPSDGGDPVGPHARADATVTFTALKPCQVFAPNCRKVGRLRLGQIGTRAEMVRSRLGLVEPAVFSALLGARDPGGNKGIYGHVLVVAGAAGKTGAAMLCGMAALRSGAGLVTVATEGTGFPPELMTERMGSPGDVLALAQKRSVVAIGPGLGTSETAGAVVRRVFAECERPVVVDADALNILAAGPAVRGPHKHLRVLTPHPGEMGRLSGISAAEVQADRLGHARAFSEASGCVLVLKGERTLIAFPDGTVWVNPTGSPAMATGGTGDVLTGMVAGMLAQHAGSRHEAIAAAVYLHGLAGELGAQELGEASFLASDVFRFLPQAMEECRSGAQRLYDPHGV